MELNHQIRLCRPFPFRFGFRAISDNIGIVTAIIKAYRLGHRSEQSACESNCGAVILLVTLQSSPPPERIDDKSTWRLAAP
jgi:hypothetical protein